MSPELIEAVLSVAILLGVGFAARKFGLLAEEADDSLLKFLVNVLLPCFIFSKVVGNPMIKNSTNAFWAPLAGFMSVTLAMLICFVVSRYILKIQIFKERSAQSTFAVATGLQNYGFVAIPVIERLFGGELLGVMLLHNMGVELAIWSIAMMLFSGKIGKGAMMKMVNGPTIMVLVSLLINALSLDLYVPGFIDSAVDSIGMAFIPFGIILVGTTIYGCLQDPEGKISKWKKDYALILSANVLRSGVLPAVLIYLASVMPYSDALLKVLIVEAAMPAAFFPIVLAKFYGGRPELAMKISLTSLIVGFAVLPFWVSFGRSVLGV
ncbi:MAG: AEC family transporter [Lentisphaerales bacterium]|nr:AEC family transporter [Lentisphaerales bacterium]